MKLKEKFKMQRKKVIVCGSTFGQFYIHALQSMPERFELVGLYGKGSERSKKCADTYGIPLITEFDQIPQVDIACVVISSGTIGGIGTDLAIRFMDKGVNVIQEQPIHLKDVSLCFRAAKRNNVYYKVCDLYPKLSEVSRFIRIANELNKKELPLYIKGAFCPQVSYPAIDILSHALPSIFSFVVDSVADAVGPFDILTGKLDDIPIMLEYNNQVFPEDRDNYEHLLHNFAFVYESGRLILEDTFGPVLWKPRMHIPKSLYNPENQKNMPAYVLENTIEPLGNYSPKHFDQALFGDWKQGIANNILELESMIDNHVDLAPLAQRQIQVSKKWNKLTSAFSFAKIIHPDGHHYIPSNDIKKFSGESV